MNQDYMKKIFEERFIAETQEELERLDVNLVTLDSAVDDLRIDIEGRVDELEVIVEDITLKMEASSDSDPANSRKIVSAPDAFSCKILHELRSVSRGVSEICEQTVESKKEVTQIRGSMSNLYACIAEMGREMDYLERLVIKYHSALISTIERLEKLENKLPVDERYDDSPEYDGVYA